MLMLWTKMMMTELVEECIVMQFFCLFLGDTPPLSYVCA